MNFWRLSSYQVNHNMKLRSVLEAGELRGKHVLLRSSLNIPLKDGVLRNKFRIERALPTLRYLHEQGARTVVVAHIGRDPKETLRPVHAELEKHLPVRWGGSLNTEGFRQRRELMGDGDILMAENIRQDEREQTNDPALVELLAQQGELFVFDAFAVAHREHASVYGIAKKLPAYAGLTIIEEVRELTKVINPQQPALFLLGGVKFQTKVPLIEKYLQSYNRVFVGGALANDIFKARGFEVGQSLVSDISLKDADFLKSTKLLVPVDVIVDGPNGRQVKQIVDVTKDEKIIDCGKQTIEMLSTYIEGVKTILWNGPLGAYEDGCVESTEMIARHVAFADGYSVVGGGDTVAAIEKLHLNGLFNHVSIGGGSMLTFLERGTLPVLELLRV
jgi:phosphoglycerate kinase